MRRLKTIFACMLMAIFSVGQVWATDPTISWDFKTLQTTSGTQSGITWETGKTGSATETACNGTNGLVLYGVASGGGYFQTTSAISGTITNVNIVSTAKKNTPKYTVYCSTDGSTWDEIAAAQTAGTKDHAVTGSYTYVKVANTTAATAQLGVASITVTYSTGGSTKTLSSVAVSGEPDKTEYYAGQDFDPAGLTVTGTYSDATQQTFTSGITWAYNPSQTLALNQTSIGVTATVSGITSAEFTVNGLTVTEAPAAASYEKVTAAPSDWSGEYLIVYENEATAYVWTGVDAVNCYETATISNDVIAQPDGTSSVTIASMEGGYSILVNGGTNDGKYIQNNGSSNGIKFVNAGVATTLTYENNAVTITCGGKKFRYNNASGNDRFRYFGSAQQVIQLYKKVDGTAKPSAELAYADAQKLAKLGVAFTAQGLTNPHSVTVSYASDNTGVATVDPATGAVSIVAAGKAVITASFAGNDDYRAGSASYTIFVAEQAGTNEDPLTEASAKALIDLGCEMTAHVAGTIFGTPSYNETYHNYSVTLTDGFQFFRLKDLGNADFTSGYLKAGDELVAVGPLAKHNTTYELAEGCYLTSYTEYTEPLVDISNTKETAYTVAQALALAVDPTSDLTKAVYIAGVVYDVKSFNSTNGTLDIYIKDEGVENKFEFYKCAGIYDESLTAFTAADDVQVGDEVIGYGVMKYYSGGSIWEFDNTATGDYLVELTRPEVAVSSVSLPATETVEVGSTVTLTATVLPDNATNKAITWTVESGDTYASVADGVVTGLVAGEAVIRAASTADPTKYAECTITVTAADPTKHKVTFDATVDQGESPLSKSNITFTCSSGALNNGSEYRLYKSSTTTFACSAGNIIKIEFTGVSGNPVSGFGNPEVGTLVTEGYDGVWTGNAASVAFVASGAQVRATEIKVTYKEDNRAEAGLAWNPADDIEITVGDAFSAPALQNPNSIDVSEISIESSNTSLATVTAGVVSLVADATGTATITATFNGNDDYKPATVSYNITVNEAGLDNVTFDSSEDHAESGETTITKSGFTLSFTSGSMDGTQAEYRLYKSQTMTLSSSSYLIKKIEFTCTSGNPISGFADAEGLDKANNQWTGEANSVELTASNAQVRMTLLKVYYIEDTRATSDLAWSTDEVEITLGDAFTAANLVNPNSIDASAITIESDNTDLAVVNDGVVSLVENATGTAHISAIFAGNETYKPANVSYTIIVLDPTPTIYVNKLNVNFASVEVGEAVPAAQTVTVTLTNVASVTATLGGTNADAFSISPASLTESGDITISILANTDAAASYAATLTISDGEEGAQDKTVNLSFEVTEPVVEDDVTGTWTLVTDATPLAAGKKVIIAQYVEANGAINTMAAQSSNNRSVIASTVAGATLTPAVGTKVMTLANAGEGKFYLMTSAGEYLYNASTSGKSYLKTKAASEDASWTISVTAAGVATIASVENTNRINMRYNENGSNPALFNCYASGQNDIALYMLEEDTPEPPTPSYTEVRTGLSADRFYTLCYDKTMTAIQGASLWQFLNKEADFAYIVEAEAPYVAGTPYLIYAESDKLEAVVEDVTDPEAGHNNGLYGTFVDMDADALSTAGATHMLKSNMIKAIGANNHLDAYRAYIKIGEIPGEAAPAPGRRVKAMPMQPQEATGLDNIFDINADGAQKLILNGQLIIIREGKMYDTTGRVVK